MENFEDWNGVTARKNIYFRGGKGVSRDHTINWGTLIVHHVPRESNFGTIAAQFHDMQVIGQERD